VELLAVRVLLSSKGNSFLAKELTEKEIKRELEGMVLLPSKSKTYAEEQDSYILKYKSFQRV